jgi:hypothetical protein
MQPTFKKIYILTNIIKFKTQGELKKVVPCLHSKYAEIIQHVG